MTNESALLGLLADLQRRIYVLDAENTALREELARREPDADHREPEHEGSRT